MTTMLKTLAEQLQPKHTAILAIDLQNDFCAVGGYMNRVRDFKLAYVGPVVTNTNALIDAVRPTGTLITWVRSHYDFKYLNAAEKVKRREEGCALEGTWGAEFFGVKPQADDPIVDKYSYGGFHGTTLHETLQSHGIKTLVFTGVATNVCVDSTLREGFFRGYYVVLAEDCVGSNSQVGHEGTLATVNNNFGTVASSAHIADLLNGKVSA